MNEKPNEPFLPQVRIGDGQPLPDDYEEDKTEDDDEQLPESPPSVVSMLGFDPLELEEDDG